jgi:lysozyme family protein
MLNDALDWIIRMEGGYVNDPKDPGGETKYGISKKNFPDLDIKNLTEEDAREIYAKDYWNPDVDGVAGFLVFDTAVNSGHKIAIKLLQRSIGADDDGILGPKTKAKINEINDKSLVKNYLMYRARFYRDLVWQKPALEKFLNGWFRRLFMLQQFLFDRGYL